MIISFVILTCCNILLARLLQWSQRSWRLSEVAHNYCCHLPATQPRQPLNIPCTCWSFGMSPAPVITECSAALRYADGPRYYSDFQLLSFNLTPPAPPLGFESWVDEGAMLAWHVAALSEQLGQLYWAMELAVLLDRWVGPLWRL